MVQALVLGLSAGVSGFVTQPFCHLYCAGNATQCVRGAIIAPHYSTKVRLQAARLAVQRRSAPVALVYRTVQLTVQLTVDQLACLNTFQFVTRFLSGTMATAAS